MTRRSTLGTMALAAALVLLAAQPALAQVEWTIGDVVLPPDPPEWDWHVPRAVVFDGTTYHMYVIGGPGADPTENVWKVGHWAWNDSLGTWDPDPANPVLEPEPGQWDGYSIMSIAVLYHEGTFHMWYGAMGTHLGPTSVGYATDADGWGDWTKVAGPLPGLNPGAPGSWDDYGMGPNTVMAEGSDLRMWYVAFEGGYWWQPWRVGHARSSDGGLTWEQEPDAPILEATEPWEGSALLWPTVVLHGGSYHMWYAGLVMDPASVELGYASSSDGLVWRKWPGNPVLSGLPGCPFVNSLAVVLEGDTIHGWVSHCGDVRAAASSFNLVFFDDFESGTTDAWSFVMP